MVLFWAFETNYTKRMEIPRSELPAHLKVRTSLGDLNIEDSLKSSLHMPSLCGLLTIFFLAGNYYCCKFQPPMKSVQKYRLSRKMMLSSSTSYFTEAVMHGVRIP